MFKIQETNLTDLGENGVREVVITAADDADIDLASEYVVFSVQIPAAPHMYLEKIQLDALRQAASLLDQVADAIDAKFQRNRGIRG